MGMGNTIALIKALSGGGGSGGGGVMIVSATVSENVATLDKTWQEIHDAFETGIVLINAVSDGSITQDRITEVGTEDDDYYVDAYESGVFNATSASGYPFQTIDNGGLAIVGNPSQ